MMTLREIFEKVREGCEMHMNQLDNDGFCEESGGCGNAHTIS